MKCVEETFRWWRLEYHGDAVTAEPVAEFPLNRKLLAAMMDAEPGRWFGTIEGAIMHGGVKAIAIERTRLETYSTRLWLETGKRQLSGTVIQTKITAVPAGETSPETGEYYEQHIAIA